MKTTKTKEQVIIDAQTWLNLYYPTHGDGEWSRKFISEIFHGEHLGHDNRPTVLQALAFAEMQ